MSAKKRKKISLPIKVLISFAVLISVIAAVNSYYFYKRIFQPNVNLGQKTVDYLYIPTGSTFEDVRKIIYNKGIIININTFKWLAEKKNYRNNVHPGRYLIKEGMNNNELINLLRSGKQKPIGLTFNNIRTREQLISVICSKLEADPSEMTKLLGDPEYLREFGLTPYNSLVMFIPNTYEFYWNTSADKFIRRMYKEYKKFWTDERIKKASQINLTPVEVSILASIVQQETIKYEEMDTIAGVYINRLKRDMLLQADPTVIFALQDFSIKRVINRYKEVDSPYNTYKYKGLPPGPICLPSTITINKVLNYKKHNYIFFCAREDFSGYHNFAETVEQHMVNARNYQNALEKLLSEN